MDDLLRINFISFAVQTLLQGLFLAVSFLSVYLMLRRRARHASKNMYAVLTGMAVIIVSVTVFWSLSFAQLFGTFFPHNNVDSTYASSNLRITSYHIKGVLFNLSLALTDLLLIYRLYIVWQDHVAVTVPPLILLCGTIVVAASSADLIKRAVTSPIDAMFYAPFAARAFAGFSLVLLINSYCTAMIAWRIWAVGRRSANSNLSESFVIFIESAAFYVAYLIASLVAYAIRLPSYIVLMDCHAVVAGLAYTLINVRVALGVARDGSLTRVSVSEWAVASHPVNDVTRHTVDLDVGGEGSQSAYVKAEALSSSSGPRSSIVMELRTVTRAGSSEATR